MTLLKICGVTNINDALMASKYADYIGVVVASSVRTPRIVDKATAINVLRLVGEDRVVAVVEGLTPHDAARLAEEMGFSIVQYHGDLDEDGLGMFRERGLRVVPVVVHNDGQLPKAKIMKLLSNATVEYVLVDAPKVGFRRYEYGLKIPLRAIEEASGMGKVGVAGGITPDNAPMVVRYRPYLIDVSSGVEKAPGVKDEELVLRLHRVVKG